MKQFDQILQHHKHEYYDTNNVHMYNTYMIKYNNFTHVDIWGT